MIPDIQYNENKVVLPVKEVPIKVNGQDEVVKIQKLSSGKRRDIMKRFVSTQFKGQSLSGNVEAMGMQLAILAEAILEAPFPTKESDLEKLPDEVVDYLYSEYSEWDKKKLTEEEK